MSYLGQIPQTTRQSTHITVTGVGLGQTITFDIIYQQEFLDVFVNGYKIERDPIPNNPSAAYRLYDGTSISSTYDGQHITIAGLNQHDIIDFVNYSTLYVAGGSGYLDHAQFKAEHDYMLANYTFTLDGGAY